MPQSKNKNKSPSGMGNIRKKTNTVNGKTYTYYEARYTEGFDPGTGKQIQRSISGKTQKEAKMKLHQALDDYRGVELTEDSRISLEEWLERWMNDYMIVSIRESTLKGYQAYIKNYIAENRSFLYDKHIIIHRHTH